MSLRKLVLCALTALGWSGSLAAQDLAAVPRPEQLGFDPARLQQLTDTYKGYVERGELPGAVLLIARADRIAYFEAIGFQDRAKGTPMRKDSIFRLASMTKPIVSVAAMMLVEEGRLDLMAPVSRYIPEFKDLQVGVEKTDPANGKPGLVMEPQKRPMIVQDLLRHTAGLVYGQFGDKLVHRAYRDAKIGDRGDTAAEMMTKLARLPLAHQPGEVWEYSVATDVLGRVVEIVSGKDLDAFVAERIAKPLGMASTDFYVRDPDLARLAEAQKPTDDKLRSPPDVTKKPRMLSGGGGLVATAGDYLRFAQMLQHSGEYAGGRLLSPHTVALMTADALQPGIGYSERALTISGDSAPTPAMGQGFGLGFAVRTAAGRNPLPGAVGSYYWNGAWGTAFWIDPAEKLVAIQMIQTPSTVGTPFRRAFRQLTYAAMTGAGDR